MSRLLLNHACGAAAAFIMAFMAKRFILLLKCLIITFYGLVFRFRFIFEIMSPSEYKGFDIINFI